MAMFETTRLFGDLGRDWVRDSRSVCRQKLERSTGPRPTAAGKGDGNYCLGQGPPRMSRFINQESSLALCCFVLDSLVQAMLLAWTEGVCKAIPYDSSLLI